jgi:hypothetical protein
LAKALLRDGLANRRSLPVAAFGNAVAGAPNFVISSTSRRVAWAVAVGLAWRPAEAGLVGLGSRRGSASSAAIDALLWVFCLATGTCRASRLRFAYV